MPNVTIEMLDGRTLEQKRDLIEKVTRAVVESLGVKPEVVRIRLSEMTLDQLAKNGVLYIDRE